MNASEVWQLAANSSRPGACEIHQCDVRSEQSIDVSPDDNKQCAQGPGKLISISGFRCSTAPGPAWHRLFGIERKRAQLSKCMSCGSVYPTLSVHTILRIQRATEISYSGFAHHLHTNTIGPIITAQRLLATGLPIGTIVFMSSDSASALNFHESEDGFGAFAASKAALNQMLRVNIYPQFSYIARSPRTVFT